MTENNLLQDGIHALLPREKMAPSARKLRDTYARVPGDPLFRREFGFYSLEAWAQQGMPECNSWEDFAALFDYDPPGHLALGQLGWTEPALEPAFEVKVIEDRGDYEVEQDFAGRRVLFFKGRRNGFMPEYLECAVKDRRTWEENVKWRLDPATPARYQDLPERMARARAAAGQGMIIQQTISGGGMYLRSMIGTEKMMYAFYDMPDVIHDMMQTWLALADAVIARHQEHVTIDELFISEDICYKSGPLIAPDMIRKFFFPYYQQLITNIKRRQLDPARHLYIQIDTDGFANPVIPLYREIGMDIMSPFEVASGCDVVEIGRQYPDLAIFGGIDKRVLAEGRKAIDQMVERILPVMRARGGYIPTCDHGVPAEVPYQDYLYYRRRCIELGG